MCIRDRAVGDKFDVFLKGKKVVNPQTGVEIELPGKKVASVVVEATLGESPLTEFSIVNVIEGSIDATDLSKYYIQEIK